MLWSEVATVEISELDSALPNTAVGVSVRLRSGAEVALPAVAGVAWLGATIACSVGCRSPAARKAVGRAVTALARLDRACVDEWDVIDVLVSGMTVRPRTAG